MGIIFDAVCEDDPFFDVVCEGEGDVTDTEETFTLRCEAAAERALWEADRLAVPDRGDRGVLRDGDTPAELEVVVHKDADGNLTGPRRVAHIGTTGGADRLPLLDRADRTAVPLGSVVRDGHPLAESRGAGTDVVLHDDAGGNTARPRQVALIGAHRVPLPDRADRAEVPLGGVVLHGHTPAQPRGAGTDVVLHDDARGNTARPHQVAPIRATGVSDQPTLPVGGSPRAHGATAAAAATPGIQQAPVTPRAPDAGGRAADGGVDACSDQNPEPAGPSGLPPALALATRHAFSAAAAMQCVWGAYARLRNMHGVWRCDGDAVCGTRPCAAHSLPRNAGQGAQVAYGWRAPSSCAGLRGAALPRARPARRVRRCGPTQRAAASRRRRVARLRGSG